MKYRGCREDPSDAWEQIRKSTRLPSMLGRLALEELVRKFLAITVSAVEKDDRVRVSARLSSSNDTHIGRVGRGTV